MNEINIPEVNFSSFMGFEVLHHQIVSYLLSALFKTLKTTVYHEDVEMK
jgi:hypothetical protein